MTTSLDGRPAATAAPVTVLPITDGDRPIGAWVVGPDTATFRPVIDVTRLTAAALACVGAVTVAVAVTALAARSRPAIGAVTMGPGGWVSVKRAGFPPLRSDERRPWWAHLLGAHRLVAKG
jgi:hypothetical protein